MESSSGRDGVHRLRRRPSFALALGVVAVVGVLVRLWFGLGVASDMPYASDVSAYRSMAENLAHGNGVALSEEPGSQPEATGAHPPFHPTVMAIADVAGLRSADQQRVVFALVGGLGVAFLGLAGRRLVDGRVGLVAAAIVAVHPLWFQPSGLLTSEATYLR
ncbi:MAG: hypothetical protein KF906_03590 [Actinobacteria bacterium]|nr:hypothetical protein [Actinomycetota bacterium]